MLSSELSSTLLSTLSSASPRLPKLVLIGGGHSHCVALANWHRSTNFPVADITLITPHETTIYSGAVPGYLAGLCDRQACELNVGTAFGINVILDEVVRLDLLNRQVICKNHVSLDFDLASINIGSTPKLPPGVIAIDRIIPMKPMAQMLDRLENHLTSHLTSHLANQRTNPISLAIVGGGLGGVEIALSLKARWGKELDVVLIARGPIAAAQPKSLQHFLRAELERHHVKVYDHTSVETAQETDEQVILQMSSGKTHRCNVSLWATEATAPSWLKISGLTTDDRGFVVVDRTLRSVSHPVIFASGDIAALSTPDQSQIFPKAGVLAVRQGQTLGQNLARSLTHKPLKSFKARSQYLSLISLGDRRAVASYGQSAILQNYLQPLLWHWKRSIDAGFVDRIHSRV